ncbi:hypothetical protein ZPR_1127 [Zunongwangia profunda SM-A87]|uniref:Uncharacterized protein n=1 Tax=Zunongwangia profunda (strain DSM 18752 / CCTCC AB 206139 / SM-A87) TaxID=655815 RepID=D5BIM0_ZUNPS|nr:hypothetical protein ZPR_1127 [Zunongwangia profunda SM-A87]
MKISDYITSQNSFYNLKDQKAYFLNSMIYFPEF